MRRLNGEKLAAARTYHAHNIHAQVIAVFGHPGFVALSIPASSGPRVAFKARLIGKPNINIRLLT